MTNPIMFKAVLKMRQQTVFIYHKNRFVTFVKFQDDDEWSSFDYNGAQYDIHLDLGVLIGESEAIHPVAIYPVIDGTADYSKSLVIPSLVEPDEKFYSLSYEDIMRVADDMHDDESEQMDFTDNELLRIADMVSDAMQWYETIQNAIDAVLSERQ